MIDAILVGSRAFFENGIVVSIIGFFVLLNVMAFGFNLKYSKRKMVWTKKTALLCVVLFPLVVFFWMVFFYKKLLIRWRIVNDTNRA